MNWAGAIIIYVIIWWCVFFAVLPWGVRGLHETGDAPEGAELGAPAEPKLLKKALITSGVAAAISAVIYVMILSGWLDMQTLSGRMLG